jgi:hypothetical protein
VTVPTATEREALLDVANGPSIVTVKSYVCTNVAVTDCVEVMVTTQVLIPLQPAPDQPVKRYPDAAVAVRVTVEPVT